MIYFIRHGESEANVRKVFAGQKDDTPITEEGKQQAKAKCKEKTSTDAERKKTRKKRKG